MNDITNLERVWSNLEPEFTDGKLGRRKRKGILGERYSNCNMIDLPFDKPLNLVYSNWGLNYLMDS